MLLCQRNLLPFATWFCCLTVFLSSEHRAYAQEPAPIRQELKALKATYQQRLEELDFRMRQLDANSPAAPGQFKKVGHITDLETYEAPQDPPIDETWLSELISNRLQVGLGSKGKLKLYGYGRGDLIYSDSRLSNTVVPFYAVSEDPSVTLGGVPVTDDDAQFNANVRLTRLGLDYSGAQAECLNCPELSAKIEIDFETLLNITRESGAVPRIRLAYGQMRWGDFSILVGQDWDVISPLNPMINDDSLMWGAGNLGDRRPMVRLKWDNGFRGDERFTIAAAMSSGGAVNNQDLDGNGVRDGEDSGIPAFQGRVGFETPSRFEDLTIGLGAWGFVGFESIDVPILGQREFTSRGVGIDWSVPLFCPFTWRGELWYGRNLSDWRGGVAQGINTTTGVEIESLGGWTELQYERTAYHKLAVGVTADNPNNSDLVGNATDRELNWTWYVGNRFNLGGGLTIYANAEFWNTNYLTTAKGDAVRLKTVLIQRF